MIKIGDVNMDEKDKIIAVIEELRKQCDEYSDKETYQNDFKRNIQIIRWLTDYMNYIV